MLEVGWCSQESREAFGINFWKATRKGWDDFCLRTSIRVGHGCWTKFWTDSWCGTGPLKDCFPKFFSLVVHKDAWVVDRWEGARGHQSS